MAAVVIVAGGIIGLIQGVISLVLGLSLVGALMAWGLVGGIASMLIWRLVLRNQDESSMHEFRMNSVRDDLAALDEAEILRATLASTDGTSMSRVLRIYAERDARQASKRNKRRPNI